MFTTFRRWAFFFAAPLLLLVFTAPVLAQDEAKLPDISVLDTVSWEQLQWLEDGRPTNPGSWYAILSGDQSTGPWVVVNSVLANNFNEPHFHPYDRYIYVIKGTWWVGAGAEQNPDEAVAVPEGSYIKHAANQVHWDGAKDEDVVLLIFSEEPAKDVFVGN